MKRFRRPDKADVILTLRPHAIFSRADIQPADIQLDRQTGLL